ncbi:MAG: hypothetical protein HXY40_03675 [Chloroflexi bacterium]|nr:hypothetical protein [Chloroflexota bacterium]
MILENAFVVPLLLAGVFVLFGQYAIWRGKVPVGLKGISRRLHGRGAQLYGGVLSLVGVGLAALALLLPQQSLWVTAGGIVAFLVVNFIGYRLSPPHEKKPKAGE